MSGWVDHEDVIVWRDSIQESFLIIRFCIEVGRNVCRIQKVRPVECLSLLSKLKPRLKIVVTHDRASYFEISNVWAHLSRVIKLLL